jgi:hypothetical protein
MVLVQSLWKLCDHFVPLCAFMIILCDTLIKLNWVVLAYNFNLVNRMLIINDSSIGAFLLTTLYLIYLLVTFSISFISCTC